jgi:hypothetical protein
MTTGTTEEKCGTPEGGPGGVPLSLPLSEVVRPHCGPSVAGLEWSTAEYDEAAGILRIDDRFVDRQSLVGSNFVFKTQNYPDYWGPSTIVSVRYLDAPQSAARVAALKDALREVLEFQSVPQEPSVHDWARWRRVLADAA